jgi:hypothetical protein
MNSHKYHAVKEGRSGRRAHWALWLPATVLLLLCCFTCFCGPNAAWALVAVRQARSFSERLLMLSPPVLTSPKSLLPNVRGFAQQEGLVSHASGPVIPAHPVVLEPSAVSSAVAYVNTPVLSTIRYAPRPNLASRMVGGKFQGSVDGVNYTMLYTVLSAPPVGKWTSITILADLTQYRYLRYLAPNGSYGNVAEIEFDSGSGTSAVKINGTGFGTRGSWNNDGNTYAKALDGGLSTFFNAPAPGNGDFVGIYCAASSFTLAASPSSVVGTTSNLSVQWNGPVTGSPTFAWTATGPATVTFSGGASANTTATFHEAGAYTITARSSTGTSSSVAVTVSSTLSHLSVSPASASLTIGQTRQFTATATDQFGSAMSMTPYFSVSGGGTISTSGLFTASAAGSNFTVTASNQPATAQTRTVAASTGTGSGVISGQATVNVQSPPPPPPPTPPAAPTPIQLPLEIMGADGTTVSVQVSVPASETVTGLWLEAHNLSYPDKASVQVNGGQWVALDNNSVQVADPGKGYGGIGGAFSTLKMVLPLPRAAVQAGTNTISFRFNMTDGVSSGFRILAFNFLDANSQPILPASDFTEDDPSTWEAPLPDAQDIAAGQNLWQNGQLLHSSIEQSPMLATCADCHTDDGRDLKYFNYSNYSIIKRAEFHGMSATQGAQIASYIRTLNVPNPGRPWNPPYQPGPGLDSQPVQDWAAGAGVDAVLPKSSDMLPYIFPSGLSASNTAANASDIAANKNLNLRELPTDLQLPDWNHWLPAVWPGDAFGNKFLSSAAFGAYAGSGTNGTNGMPFDMVQMLSQPQSKWPSLLQIQSELNKWQTTVLLFAQNQKSSQVQGSGTGLAPGDAPFTYQTDTEIYSISLWARVKEWEIMQDFNLEQQGTNLYGPTTGNSPTEPRTWLSGGTFDTSPAAEHITFDADNTGNISQLDPVVFSLSPFAIGTPTLYQYVSNQWYYLQAVLFAGDRHTGEHYPIDWPYAMGRIKDLAFASGVGGSGRLAAISVKSLQQRDDGVSPNEITGGAPGFGLNSGYINSLACVGTSPALCDVTAPTKAAIIGAVVQSFLNTATSNYTVAQYQEEMYPYYDPPTSPTPTQYMNPGANGDVLDQLYFVFPDLTLEGVDPHVVSGYRDFLADVWPNVDWTDDTSKKLN